MRFASAYRRFVFSCLALSLLVLAPPAARADDAITPPKIDLTRNPDLPLYSDEAKLANEQGDTILAIAIEANGRVSKVSVETSSGFQDLDKIAIKAVDGWRFVAANDGHKDVAAVLKVTVHFRIAALPSPAITVNEVYAVSDPMDQIICKRLPPAVGSQLSPPPKCASRRAWEEAAKREKRAVPLDRPVPVIRPF